MTQRRVILTGATSMLGRPLLDRLNALPDTQTLCLLRRESPLGRRVNFDNRAELQAVINEFRPTHLIHTAATGMQSALPAWDELIRFNVATTVALAECAGDCHFLHVSTGLAYRDLGRPLREDDPLDTRQPYAASKAAADLLVRAAGKKVTVLRPFSFTGRGDSPHRLFPSIVRSRTLDLSPCDQIRDYAAAADIADGILAALTTGATGVFNLGTGRAVPLRQLIEEVVAELGLKVELRFGARPASPHEPRFLVADITRARRELHWEPRRSLASAVKELLSGTGVPPVLSSDPASPNGRDARSTTELHEQR
jgi:nucleoside-diphosphate-sugar epimerase